MNNPSNLVTAKKRETNEDYCGVFRERLDKDWDFVACICCDDSTFPMLSQAHNDQSWSMVEMLAEAIEAEGERTLLVWSTEPDFPHVYEHKAD